MCIYIYTRLYVFVHIYPHIYIYTHVCTTSTGPAQQARKRHAIYWQAIFGKCVMSHIGKLFSANKSSHTSASQILLMYDMTHSQRIACRWVTWSNTASKCQTWLMAWMTYDMSDLCHTLAGPPFLVCGQRDDSCVYRPFSLQRKQGFGMNDSHHTFSWAIYIYINTCSFLYLLIHAVTGLVAFFAAEKAGFGHFLIDAVACVVPNPPAVAACHLVSLHISIYGAYSCTTHRCLWHVSLYAHCVLMVTTYSFSLRAHCVTCLTSAHCVTCLTTCSFTQSRT